VTDLTGAGIPGAMVWIQNTGTYIIAETKTCDTGAYAFNLCSPVPTRWDFPKLNSRVSPPFVEPGRRRDPVRVDVSLTAG
jgi:hypothetical protein